MDEKTRRAGILWRPTWFLFVVCFASLYWEILLIRWLPSELPLLGYFKSLVILASFLGMGMGCLAYERFRVQPRVLISAFLLGVCLIAYTVWLGGDNLRSRGFGPASGILQQSGVTSAVIPQFTLEFVGQATGGTFVILIVFIAVTLLFMPLGSVVARLFDFLPPLWAYLINLLGSLLGTLVFVGFSFAGYSPLVWFFVGSVACLPLFILGSSSKTRFAIGLSTGTILSALVVLGISLMSSENVLWSPYQRISWVLRSGEVVDIEGKALRQILFGSVYVNHEYHQKMVRLDIGSTIEEKATYCAQVDHALRQTDTTVDSMQAFLRRYEAPYQFAPNPRRVLIIAAGNGNEAAAALRHGVKEIDAVEIDPGIIEIGRQYHPEHPYSSPYVNIVADDARGFVQRTKKRYDLIVMNAVDSHSQFATSAGLRLDSYIFVQEFFEQIRNLMTNDGLFVLEFSGYHWYKNPWCKERLQEMLWRAFGYSPRSNKDLLAGAGGPIFVIPRGTPPSPSEWNHSISISTDDWPQFFVQEHIIPIAYQQLIIAVLVLCAVFLFIFLPRGKRRPDLHFAFLGAAFMMLEIKSITELSLAFGATWLVSSMVIASILAAIGIANLAVWLRGTGSYRLGYGILFLGLVIVVLFPPKTFMLLGFEKRALIACFRVAIPVFGAALVFAQSFRRTLVPSTAFGWNLVGAMIGGLGEYLSLVFSVSALSYFIIFLYAASLITLRFTRFRE